MQWTQKQDDNTAVAEQPLCDLEDFYNAASENLSHFMFLHLVKKAKQKTELSSNFNNVDPFELDLLNKVLTPV